jgi:hypothetical protein
MGGGGTISIVSVAMAVAGPADEPPGLPAPFLGGADGDGVGVDGVADGT